MSYSEISATIKDILKHYKWNIIGVLYHNFVTAEKGHSDCSLCLAPLKLMSNKTTAENHQTFAENVTHVELKGKLEELKKVSRSKFCVENKNKMEKINNIQI